MEQAEWSQDGITWHDVDGGFVFNGTSDVILADGTTTGDGTAVETRGAGTRALKGRVVMTLAFAVTLGRSREGLRQACRVLRV